MPNIEEQLQSLVLSAEEIKDLTGWPEAMIEDYLNIVRNFILVAGGADDNTEQIDQNIQDIAQNAQDIADHIADDSAHGVTGENVGTEDFCTDLIGGVVLLADLVADVVDSTVEVTSPDASAAPVAYDQTQIQEIVDLANEMKGDVNQLVDDVNDAIDQFNLLLAAMKTANQMSLV